MSGNAKEKTLIIVQARMASTRLPEKILKVADGKSLLLHQIERLRRVKNADQLLVATTRNSLDDRIEEFCALHRIDFYRGSESDVLSRYYEAAHSRAAQYVVRLTSDCPLIDPNVLENILNVYKTSTPQVDYVSNTLTRTFPRGMDIEVFSMKVLSEAHHEAREGYEREHVTPFIYLRPQRYRLMNVEYHTDESRHRWTVDTAEDFELISRMLEALSERKGQYSLEDCLELLRAHPDWVHVNAQIEQKKLR